MAGAWLLCRVVVESIEVISWHIEGSTAIAAAGDRFGLPPSIRVEVSPNGLYLWVTLQQDLWVIHLSPSLEVLAARADGVIAARLKAKEPAA